MQGRIWLIVGVVWLASLVLVGSLTYAQVVQVPANPPNLITGADLGFQIEGKQNDRIMGRLMVRVKGQWLPVGGPGAYPAK
jgi:hypothetical protein